METTQKPEFLKMLARMMGSYGKPLPEAGLLSAWWEDLQLFPLPVVAMAFSQYRDESGEFAPVPAGIAKRCKLMDGRPTDEEAWAIALTSRNEEDTVVWTSETAEAFGICSSILALGDEVGARMAFKDAYNRLVSAARAACKPADWNVSLGWDGKKREAAIKRASVAGYLSAPFAKTMLPDYSDSPEREEKSPEGLARLKEEVAKLQAGWALNAERRAAEVRAEREAVAARKQELADQAAAYERGIVDQQGEQTCGQ